MSGIGETFPPDLYTGTGNFTLPIALPPGRNGVHPTLNLLYSTGNGNSPFGFGWHLSIPGVSRKTTKAVPRYLDGTHDLIERDTFILSGAEDLMPVGEVQHTVIDNAAPLALNGQTISYYHSEAFEGLPFRQLGDFGAVSRSETLVLTEAILQAAYRNDEGEVELTPFLDPTGPPAWTVDYPQEFRAHLPVLAGYLFHRPRRGQLVHYCGCA